MDWEKFQTFSRMFYESDPDANLANNEIEPSGEFYAPVATKKHKQAILEIFAQLDREIQTVYDLGAGDFRLSKALEEEGYNVIGYEENFVLVEKLLEYGPNLKNVEIRTSDYMADWDDIRGNPNACYIVIGKSNESPDPPKQGILIEGYKQISSVFVDGVERQDLS